MAVPEQFAKKNPGVVAAMAMKRDKRPVKKSGKKHDDGMKEAAARRLANLNKGK